ncbi:MAG: glycoside hydrolase family 13 protein [Propionibacteriaceae bacterium]|jgi:alpha-glucosidase|nr:glycoside hydrolase family 13 protein [Propionibacteriaceae bacterium]
MQPHHDGSALYVENETPQLGESVELRVRIPADFGERAVWLRHVEDGEPQLVRAKRAGNGPGERWYAAELPIHHLVSNYRWQLDVGSTSFWLNGRGVIDHDVTDEADFRITTFAPAPSWARGAVIYQIFPDRFARSAHADQHPTPAWAKPARWNDESIGVPGKAALQFYGGDLGGIEEHLSHISALGVDAIYLTPVFPAPSNHRYNASSFDHVDPLLGGDQALASLSKAAHARGIKIFSDLTTNHTGSEHEWFRTERDFYYWQPYRGLDYVGWFGHKSLPKLNWGAERLWERMVDGPDSIVAKYLSAPFELDGWRIDVANMTGRFQTDDHANEVARHIRATMEEADPESLLISEHWHDAQHDLRGDGWHANMNYSGFTRPMWSWLSKQHTPHGKEAVWIPARGGRQLVTSLKEFGATVPWKVTSAQWNIIGSHDTPRIRTLVGSAALVEVAAALAFTYPGSPFFFAGDEGGLLGHNGEAARQTMPWDDIPAGGRRWDPDTAAVFHELGRLRHACAPLRTGGLRWVFAAEDAVGFLRETAREKVLVVLARAPWAGTTLPFKGDPHPLYQGRLAQPATCTPTHFGLQISGAGPAVGVWRIG